MISRNTPRIAEMTVMESQPGIDATGARKNPPIAFVVGIFVTAAVQSSSVSSV